MFFKTTKPTPEHESALDLVITAAMPHADQDTRRIVVAIAGLLGCVSYADRKFGETEKQLATNLLQTVHGVGTSGAWAILAALEQHIIHVATVEAPRYARTLKDLGDRELRLHVLDMLLDVAAVDHHLSHHEVVVLRQVTTALGLLQSDYNDLQSKHKDKLGTLRADGLDS